MDETLQNLLGGGLPQGLLTPQQEATAEQRARNAGLLNLAFGMLQASRGAPGQRAPSLGQVIGQAGPVGVQAYQQSFDQTLGNLLKGLQVRSMVTSMNAPKFEKIKTPSGGELLLKILPNGTVTPVSIDGVSLAKAIDFDAPTQAFINLKFGKPYEQLTPEQKTEVLQFNNAPNDEKLSQLKVETGKFKFESGKDIPVPRGRSEFLIAPPGNVVPQVSPSSTPQVSPVAPPAAPRVSPVSQVAPESQPTSAEVSVSDVSKLRVPITLVSRTMTEKEIPLVSDPRIPPKQQAVILEAKPQTQSSVEYVINTNRAMRNTIQQILSSKGFNDAFGLGGQTLSKIPGSPAADVLGDLEKLGGSLFIEAITALRNASKTGAGVGNATEREGDKLERSKASIQQFRSPQAARSELERLLKSLEEAERNVLNAYERTYGKGSFNLSPLETPASNRRPIETIFGVPQK